MPRVCRRRGRSMIATHSTRTSGWRNFALSVPANYSALSLFTRPMRALIFLGLAALAALASAQVSCAVDPSGSLCPTDLKAPSTTVTSTPGIAPCANYVNCLVDPCSIIPAVRPFSLGTHPDPSPDLHLLQSRQMRLELLWLLQRHLV